MGVKRIFRFRHCCRTIASLSLPVHLFLGTIALAANLFAADPAGKIFGRVTDPRGATVSRAQIKVIDPRNSTVCQTPTDAQGYFFCSSVGTGEFSITATAAAFDPVTVTIRVDPGVEAEANVQFRELASQKQAITVTADVKQVDVLSPDPAEKVFASEDLLDANPGRPGAPISIPGYPIETASSGIKAPQYFAPGVAGDHGEPIAQFIQVGSYLVPNNLSANAHGNGYADPNIYIADVIESVEVDGGAFNVREGNHALNLGDHLCPALASRSVLHLDGRPAGHHGHGRLESFSSTRGSRWRARTAMDSWTGWSTASSSRSMAGGSFIAGDHTLTLFGIGYYGFSYVAGLRPMYGFNSVDAADGWTEYPDTIDPRQKDQTHTALMALNDVWNLGEQPAASALGLFPNL